MIVELYDVWPMKPIRDSVTELFPGAKQSRIAATTLRLEIENPEWLLGWITAKSIRYEVVG